MDVQSFISAVAATLKWSMPLLAIALLVILFTKSAIKGHLKLKI
jgi:hypothetical protein